MDQFGHGLDATDIKLVKTLNLINPTEIYKRFGPKARNERDFYINRFKDQIKKLVMNFVNRNMAEAVSLLKDREVFTMGNDGYPAKVPVRISDALASLRFHFIRNDQHTRYFPTISLFGRPLDLHKKGTAVVVEEPAWLLHNQYLFTFDQAVEGKKLIPFLRRDFIAIPPATEETYFKKFVPQIIERYPVDFRGIGIEEVNEEPRFRFKVDLSQKDIVSMDLQVVYGKHVLKPDPSRESTARPEMRKEGQFFTLIRRMPALEADVISVLERMVPQEGLMGLDFMDRITALQWLSHAVPELESHGIEVFQVGEETMNFEQPEVHMEMTEEGDWFDIKAVVKIGRFQIPFIKFKSHILKGRRDFVLPDGSIAILPDSWFTDYRHLVEVAKEGKEGSISIRKYQAAVLSMQVAGTGFKEQLGKLADMDKVPETKLPQKLRADLRAYQKRGYDWLGFLRENSFGGILADDMGLGKTLQTLSLLQCEKEAGAKQPSLIVMPTSLVYNWEAEAAKFTPELRLLNHTGVSRTKNSANFSIYDVILTTYGIVRQDLDMLRAYPFHYIILDEGQMIKNPASKTAKAVKLLSAQHRLSLSGTPLENSLMDLWSQMTFLNPGLLGSERFFKNFYAQPIEKGRDEKRQGQLKRLIHPFILRRTKEQVATELPEKIEQRHYCEMTDEQRRIYDETKNAYRNYLLELAPGDFNSRKLNILAGLQKLRQIAIHPGLVEEGAGSGLEDSGKYQEFRRLLDEVLSKGAKVLVFSQFVRLLQMLKGDLEKEGVSFAYLDGSTKDRRGQVERFQTNDKVKVFLISLKAGGIGLNLTAAEYVFILDPWWNPAVEAQAVDRSHRIGQLKTVFSYKFITRDSIEEKILKLQERKSKLSSDIVSVEDEIFKSLKMEDFQDLLS